MDDQELRLKQLQNHINAIEITITGLTNMSSTRINKELAHHQDRRYEDERVQGHYHSKVGIETVLCWIYREMNFVTCGCGIKRLQNTPNFFLMICANISLNSLAVIFLLSCLGSVPCQKIVYCQKCVHNNMIFHSLFDIFILTSIAPSRGVEDA